MDLRNIRNRRRRMLEAQDGGCWYCGIPCILPVEKQDWPGGPDQATIEHQHSHEGRVMEVVRTVVACKACNSQKGGFTSALDAAAWATNGGVRRERSNRDVVQQASGEAV